MLDHPPALTDPDEPERFDFEGWPLTVVWIAGERHWILAEVCEAVDLPPNPQYWASVIEPDETLSYPVETDRGPQEVLVLTEPGLYHLLGTCRQPAARRFTRWVNHELLPAVRRGEVAPVATPALPQTYAEALRELADQAEGRALAERKVAELEPRAQIADDFLTLADGHLVTVEDWAKTLSPLMTGIEAMAKLRELGIVSKRRNTLRGPLYGQEVNLPNEPYASQGYFRVTDDEVNPGLWTKVARLTPRGQVWLRQIFAQYGWTS